MLAIRILLQKLWVKVMWPIWSFIVNLCYWICRPFSIKEALAKKKALLDQDLKSIMTIFWWRQDRFKDWYPWVITIVNKDISDDCDGAASLAKWWWKKHGVSSRFVYLYTENFSEGHVVCVANSNLTFVSNSEVIDIDPSNWQQDLLSRFNNMYSIVIE